MMTPMTALLLFVFLGLCMEAKGAINVALHAQVSPSEKVVGSAVTTEGMKAAFLKRKEIGIVEIFYPFYYLGFLNTSWDMLLIEGWFPSINSFVAVARAMSPNLVVLFYCLDPIYPGMNRVFELDVDGYLTNSKVLTNDLTKKRPTVYLPLAADPQKMKPIINVSRIYGAVYVGAGGNMLKTKPLLYEILRSSVPFGLRLHGAHWEEDPVLEESYKGVLPQGSLHEAYASANAVLASTVERQKNAGMINNRIFEALSCGSVVISDYSDSLNETFGDILQFVNSGEDVEMLLKQLADPAHEKYFQNIRERGREIIIAAHTWEHRIIEILDFYLLLNSKPSVTRDSSHFRSKELIMTHYMSNDNTSLPQVAWIVSDHLLWHPDYILSVEASINNYFSNIYQIHRYSESEWLEFLLACRADNLSFMKLAQYTIVFAVFSHFDALHEGLISFHQWRSDAFDGRAITVRNASAKEALDRMPQKYMSFLLGVDEKSSKNKIWNILSGNFDSRGIYMSEIFDVVLFRDSFERSVLSRIEKESYAETFAVMCSASGNTVPSAAPVLRNRTCDFPNIMNEAEEFKWRVCFGVWSSRPDDERLVDPVAEPKNSSQYQKIALCFLRHKDSCTAWHRSRVASNSEQLTLLLVGGELSSWTMSCAGDIGSETINSDLLCVLGDVPLRNVMHIRRVLPGLLTDVLYKADELLMMFHDDCYEIEMEKGTSFDRSLPREQLLTVRTLENIIWPLLFGGKHQKSIRLYRQPSAHVSHLLENNAWHKTDVAQQWKDALTILFSFGTFNARCDFVANYINPDDTDGGGAGVMTRMEEPSPFSEASLQIYIQFTNFVPGLDGQVCFYLNGVFAYCRYSREMYMLEISTESIGADTKESSSSPFIKKSVTLRVELRGFLYLQPFYVTEETYSFCFPNHLHSVEANFPECRNGTFNRKFTPIKEQVFSGRYDAYR